MRRFLATSLLVAFLFSPSLVWAKESDAIAFTTQIELYMEHELLPAVIPEIPGNSHVYLMPRLVEAGRKRGLLGVTFLHFPDAFPEWPFLWGYYEKKSKVLLIEMTLTPNSQVATIIHEMGHHLQPAGLGGSEGQVFAETVAYLVCKRLGLDTFKSSATYLRQFQHRFSVTQRFAKEIDAAVEALVRDIK
jgi:hypothetical protein